MTFPTIYMPVASSPGDAPAADRAWAPTKCAYVLRIVYNADVHPVFEAPLPKMRWTPCCGHEYSARRPDNLFAVAPTIDEDCGIALRSAA